MDIRFNDTLRFNQGIKCLPRHIPNVFSAQKKMSLLLWAINRDGFKLLYFQNPAETTIKSRHEQRFCQVGVIAKVLCSVWEEGFRSVDKDAAERATAWAVSGSPLQLSGILKHVSSLCLGKTELCSSDNCVTACTVMYVRLGAWCARK